MAQLVSADTNSVKVMLYIKDMDDARRESERKRQALEDALTLAQSASSAKCQQRKVPAAQSASSAKTDFLSRMSHDIRTPMNAIIGMSTIAAANLDNRERLADCLGKIGVSARFLLSLINDILDMSKIESGKMTMSRKEFNIQELINGVIAVVYPQALEKGLDFEAQIDNTLAQIYIGDALRINQILMNLLSNALKFTPKGGKITLHVRQLHKSNDVAKLYFEVQDTGIGIPPEFIKGIFEPFEQSELTRGRVFEGSGLGLSITRNLVHLMNGRIDVLSKVG